MLHDDDLFAMARITCAASDAELDAAEAILSVLPQSYRAFAKRYGGGVACGLVVLCSPAPGGDLIARAQVLTARLRLRISYSLEDGAELGGVDCLEPYDDGSRGVAARYRELVVFANSINGEFFAWLPVGDTFIFYAIDRACLSVRFGGYDLCAMIRALQTEQVKDILGSGYTPLPSTFEGF